MEFCPECNSKLDEYMNIKYICSNDYCNFSCNISIFLNYSNPGTKKFIMMKIYGIKKFFLAIPV